ncbi:MAG: hypothetical protein AAGG75_07885 [Bacteroidota bacterium]
MQRILAVLLFALLVGQSACLIKPEDEIPDPWKLAFEDATITPIRNMHASPTEFYVITDDEFIRLDNNNNIIERRKLTLPFRFFGRPQLSDNVFTRVTRQGQSDQIIEFHLAKIPGQVYNYSFEQLEAETGDQLFPETSGRYTAAFNDVGTQMLLPASNSSKDIYTLLLFDIELNSNNSEILNVSLRANIDVTDLQNDPNSISNTRFVDGHYYVTSLNGAFRVGPDGSVTKIFQQWMLDFFSYEDSLFVTSSAAQLFTSSDSGLSWREWDEENRTELQFVEVANNNVFSQPFTGFPFQMADEDLLSTRKVRLNQDFVDDVSAYNNIRFFFDKYYLANQKELYFTDDIKLEE